MLREFTSTHLLKHYFVNLFYVGHLYLKASLFYSHGIIQSGLIIKISFSQRIWLYFNCVNIAAYIGETLIHLRRAYYKNCKSYNGSSYVKIVLGGVLTYDHKDKN